MTGWLVNDKLTCIPGTRTFWNHLLDNIPGLVNKTTGRFMGLADETEFDAARETPGYIIRNAAYFRRLDVPCQVISVVQDILDGDGRDLLISACEASRLVVFNSEYTRTMYPELHAMTNRIIPIGTDETIFRPCSPDPDIPSGAVLWIGSGHHVKGFDLACQLADESDRPWVFVMKDDSVVPVDGSIVYRRISQERLAAIASACAVGVCTSKRETQHLAGIEAGMCGLALVTTDVGAYYGRKNGIWGQRTDRVWHHAIDRAAVLPRKEVAQYWRDSGFGLSDCMDVWRSTIAMLEPSYVLR